MDFPRKGAESEKKEAQDITEGNSRRQDKQPRERTPVEGRKEFHYRVGAQCRAPYRDGVGPLLRRGDEICQ